MNENKLKPYFLQQGVIRDNYCRLFSWLSIFRTLIEDNEDVIETRIDIRHIAQYPKFRGSNSGL